MSKFTEGRASVPQGLGVSFRLAVNAFEVVAVGPVATGVVVDRIGVDWFVKPVAVWSARFTGAWCGAVPAAWEDLATGTRLFQSGNYHIGGLPAVDVDLAVGGQFRLEWFPQYEVRSGPVWFGLGIQVPRDAIISGYVWLRTVWPGFYGGERVVVVRPEQSEGE